MGPKGDVGDEGPKGQSGEPGPPVSNTKIKLLIAIIIFYHKS